ncbi:MAG: hypothetical protein Q9208_001254, partial [Pyrenodesmia sp. 3 TL-2023]
QILMMSGHPVYPIQSNRFAHPDCITPPPPSTHPHALISDIERLAVVHKTAPPRSKPLLAAVIDFKLRVLVGIWKRDGHKNRALEELETLSGIKVHLTLYGVPYGPIDGLLEGKIHQIVEQEGLGELLKM